MYSKLKCARYLEFSLLSSVDSFVMVEFTLAVLASCRTISLESKKRENPTKISALLSLREVKNTFNVIHSKSLTTDDSVRTIYLQVEPGTT